MDELIDKLKQVSNLSQLDNIQNFDSNQLLFAILKSDRTDLLNDNQ